MPGSCAYPIDRGFAFVIVSDTSLVSKQNRVVAQKEVSHSFIDRQVPRKPRLVGGEFHMGYEMLKGLTKKLFGRGPPAQSSEGFFLNVRCSACGEVFNLFTNKSTDLAQNFDGFVKSPTSVRHVHGPEQSRRAALYYIPCPVKLKAAISKDMGYRRCLKTVTSNKENI